MEAKTQMWEKLLKNAGMSKYESRIYVTLAIDGPSEARKLSMACNVPRTKVYGTLKKLVDRGLIIEIPEAPRSFTITSPTQAFNTILKSLKTELSEKVTSLIEFETAISFVDEIYKKRQQIKPIESQMGDVWFTQGRSEILRKINEILSKAQTFVGVQTTENGLILFHKSFTKLLDTLVQRGVNIHIKAPIGTTNKRLFKELRYAYKMKPVNTHLPILFVHTDQNEFLLAKPEPDDFNLESGEDFGFFSRTEPCTRSSALY